MLPRVTLNKKERNLTIAVGVTIGVTLSWSLLSMWKDDREAFEKNLPGNYDSNRTAHGQPLAVPPPMKIQARYPGGRVLYHVDEVNSSVILPDQPVPEQVWILTTRNGKYKFVRVEQAVPVDANAAPVLNLYRGAEVFAWTRPGVSEDDLRDTLPEERYNLLGKNDRRGCYLIQFREVSPAGLPAAMRELAENSAVSKVEPCPID